jgi:hypothetical protein
LIWLKNAGCFSATDYASANAAAAALSSGQCGLTDGSSAGNWRLPTRDEWGALLMGMCHAPGFPALPDRTGFDCYAEYPADPWAIGVSPSVYWSSTSSMEYLGSAWNGDLVSGFVYQTGRNNSLLVWPVRDR